MAGVRGKALVVGTTAALNDELATMMAAQGFDVIIASDARFILDHAGQDCTVVVVAGPIGQLDIAEFSQVLRADPTTQSVPIIVVTPREDRELRKRALKAGANDFVYAPVDRFELAVRLRNLLKASSASSSASVPLDAVADQVVILDKQGCIETGNTKWLNVVNRRGLGTSGGTGVKYVDIGVLTDPEQIAAFEQARHAVNLGVLPYFELEVSMPVDGSHRWFGVRMSRISSGSTPRTIITHRDITDQRTAQRQIALADRLASVGTLAAGVAHEINNPLTYVLANTETLVAEQRFPEDPEATQMLRDSLQGLRRVQSIVKVLHAFARREDDEATPSDVNAAIRGALVLSRRQLQGVCDITTDLVVASPVACGPGPMIQVLLNLLVNAAQCFDRRRETEPEIHIRGRQIGEEVHVSVIDNGPGIAPHVLPHIFDAFFTTKRSGKGSGLGLAICQDLIEAHGGRIEVESTVGKGTTFTIIVPTATYLPDGDTMVPSLGLDRGSKVLVVDDEPLVAKALARLLAARYTVVTAHSVAEAISVLNADAGFHAILCDLMLGDGLGAQVYDHVVANQPDLVRKIMVMTGGAVGHDAVEFLSRSSVLTIDKPIDASKLMRTIKSVIIA